MAPARLNLAGLRTRFARKPPQHHDRAGDPFDGLLARPVSRRAAIQVTGGALAGFVPGLERLHVLLGGLELVGDDRRLAFVLGSQTRWVIDATRFAGRPTLRQRKRTDGSVRIDLSGARFPGTALPADFTCEVVPGLLGSEMRLELALGRFRCQVPFEAWLLDRARARSQVRLRSEIRASGGGPGIALRGPAEAELLTDGSIRFAGAGIAALAGLGRTIRSDTVTLGLADTAAGSLLGDGTGPSTSIVLERGSRDWRLRPALPTGGHGTLVFPDEPFDRVSLQAVEKGRRRALAAEASSPEDGVAAHWEPVGDLVDGRGEPARIPLADVRYAVALDGRSGQRSLMARIYGPTWLHGRGFSLEVSDSGDHPALEVVETDGRLEALRVEPELRRVVVPVAGAIVEPMEVATGARIALTALDADGSPTTAGDGDGRARADAGGARAAVAPGEGMPSSKAGNGDAPPTPGRSESLTNGNGARRPAARVELDPHGDSRLVMAAAPPLALLRPEDLLSVAFQFVNLGLVVEGAGRARLVRESGQEAPGSFLVVHFQSQHITERAFKDPGEEPKAGDVPVEAIIAGRSRLAFRVPTEADGLPYSLESLLDWTRLEPSIVATALPPAPPMLLVQARVMQLARPEVSRRQGQGVEPALIARPSVLKAAPEVDPQARQMISRELSRNVARGERVSDQQLDAIAATLTQTRPGYRAIPQPEMERIIAKVLQRPYDPRPWETSIEAPWRLELSPNRFSAWAHSSHPVAADWNETVRITELWHSRLAVRRAGELEPGESPIDEGEDYYRTLRAVWSPDYDRQATKDQPPRFGEGSHPGNPFRMSLDAWDRNQLVTLTSDFTLPRCETRVVRAERFMLTALGAWMNVGGRWALNVLPPDALDFLSVEEWRHRATMARDQFVKVVYRGYLFPFGHAAALVKITERELQPGRQNLTAFLRQRFYVVVRQPDKEFPTALQPHDGRKLPFRRVRLVTLETPALDDASKSEIAGQGQGAFWLRVGNSDFLFHVVAEDLEGRPVEFTTPLAFIDGTQAVDVSVTQAAASSLAGSPARKTRPVQGQTVTYAASAKSGDTTFETDTLTFEAAVLTEPSNAALRGLDQPRFWPGLEAAAIELPAVKRLTGAVGAVPIRYPQRYLEKGFAGGGGGNEGQVFAELVSAVGLGFGGGSAGTDKVGALVNPDLSISGLSRLSGPVSGDLQEMIDGSFDPQKFFAGLDAKILGGLSLRDIVQAVTSGLGPQLDTLKGELESTLKDLGEKVTTAAIESLPKSPVPAFITQLVYDDGAPGDLENVAKLPKQIQLVFKWDPKVTEFEVFRVDGDPEDTLSLTSVALIPLSPEGVAREPSYTVSASLQRFTLNLFGIIAIKVKSVSFKKAAGDKPDVKADIDDIEFQGPLAFVEELQSVIPSDSFVSPDIDVLPTGIQAGIDLALPTIGTGVFTLADVSLGARLGVPFTGDPLRFRFNFCKREQPFVLTVYGLGGGGFFAIEMGLDGVELLEAALEFGAAIAVDFGVASGGVSVKAGIYFAMEADNALLTGYFRLAGHLDVLGLITASLVFYLALTWQQSPEMVWGEAMLTIEVEVLFFSASVSIKCRKEFTTPPPPSFADLMTESEWTQYRLAFA